MTIFISASMTFSEKILEVKKQLEELGHTVLISLETEEYVNHIEDMGALKNDLETTKESGIFKRNLNEVAKAEAILTLNVDKHDTSGYVGPSALIEMGLGYYLGKKLFLWQDVPHHSQIGWAYEVRLMQPTVLNSDITKIE